MKHVAVAQGQGMMPPNTVGRHHWYMHMGADKVSGDCTRHIERKVELSH